ncbi:MAG TPA: hypothetical protein VEI80_00055, partial [Candidatus Acidoferrales bacterium]|nr:hypothetical protein [Candidatus Acidoferrales bacterium]
MNKIKVVQYGLGPIGLGTVEFLLTRPWVELVGAVDVDRSKVGKDVGQLLASPRKTGIVVSENSTDVLRRVAPNVVTHATSSYMNDINGQLLEIVGNGVSVVSTAEELTYPFAKYSELSK